MVQITVKKLEETTTLCTEAPATPNVTLQTHNQGMILSYSTLFHNVEIYSRILVFREYPD